MASAPISGLENTLDYAFVNKALLKESLRHSSFVNEQAESGLRDNERLEFLGDAVINLIAGHLLMRHFPDLDEGELSRMRAQLVNETQLAAIARKMDLGAYIQLGKGEMQSQGRNKPSILADTVEALIAAVYLDGGFDAAFQMGEAWFSDRLDRNGVAIRNPDYKSQLQELIQTTRMPLPTYTVIREEGPDHDKTFQVLLTAGELHAEGIGKNKKAAEQAADGNALERLNRLL